MLNGPKWWIFVGPWIHFFLLVVMDVILCPLLECAFIFGVKSSLEQTGFYPYYIFCACLQIAFVLLFLRQQLPNVTKVME
jgi:hypothetical protein